MARRFDRGRLDKASPVAGGGVRIPAYLTRTGVFTYRRQDGTTIRELRHPEEVFRADSLRSLEFAPVTDLHPPAMVSPGTWKGTAAGVVAPGARADGQFVAADLVVQDAAVIAKVEARERTEISCGYNCDLDPTPGVYNGERYDVVQRNIVYNHVALGPDNWGRAGNEVRVRLDSNDDAIRVDHSDTPAPPAPTKEKKMPKYVKIDGIDYDVETPAFDQAWAKHNETVAALMRSEVDKVSKLTTERDTLAAKCDSLEKATAAKIDAAVQLRLDAKAVLADDFDSTKSDREIMIACIAKHDSAFTGEGKSDDYLRARFDTYAAEAKANATKVDTSRDAHLKLFSGGTPDEKKDSDDIDPIEQARLDNLKHLQERGTKPLTLSREK